MTGVEQFWQADEDGEEKSLPFDASIFVSHFAFALFVFNPFRIERVSLLLLLSICFSSHSRFVASPVNQKKQDIRRRKKKGLLLVLWDYNNVDANPSSFINHNEVTVDKSASGICNNLWRGDIVSRDSQTQSTQDYHSASSPSSLP